MFIYFCKHFTHILTSLSIFSIHILRCWQGQFIESWIKSLRKVKLSLLGVNGLDLSQWLSYRLIHVGCTIQTSFDIIYPNHVILKPKSATLILWTVKMILHSNYLFINDQNNTMLKCYAYFFFHTVSWVYNRWQTEVHWKASNALRNRKVPHSRLTSHLEALERYRRTLMYIVIKW